MLFWWVVFRVADWECSFKLVIDIGGAEFGFVKSLQTGRKGRDIAK